MITPVNQPPSFCYWAVPWFFLCSGVFFAHSLHKYAAVALIKNKAGGLLVPYLLWAGIGGLTVYSAIPEESWLCLDAVFAFCKMHPIGNGPLWYIRALMIFMTIGVGVKSLPLVCNAACIVIGVVLLQRVGVEVGPGSSPFYFALGMLISKSLLDGVLETKYVKMVCLVGFLVSFGLRVAWFGLGGSFAHQGSNLLSNCSVVFMIVAFYELSSLVARRVKSIPMMELVAGATSFVYFTHMIFMRLLRRVFVCEANLLFLILAGVTIVSMYGLAVLMKCYVPKLYLFCTGGRK